MAESEAEPFVLTERRGGVSIIRLNEPRTLNALSPGIKAGLAEAVAGLSSDPGSRAIVITGTGRAFCAGGDIRSMDEHRAVPVRRRMQASHEWVLRLMTCEKPVLAAVNGVAAGAGFSIALMADIVYAAEDARFKAGFPGIGAAPDLALAYTLPRAVGAMRAREILLTNREVSAVEAQALGFVAAVYPAAGLLDEVLAIADTLACGPSVSFGQTKRLIARSFELPLEAFLEQEAYAQMTAFGSDDFAEGVAAFRAKRKPEFRGE